MENKLTMPVTGGFFSTNLLIVVGVAIAFIIGYVIFCVLRDNKKDDLKEFKDDDFVDYDNKKQ